MKVGDTVIVRCMWSGKPTWGRIEAMHNHGADVCVGASSFTGVRYDDITLLPQEPMPAWLSK